MFLRTEVKNLGSPLKPYLLIPSFPNSLLPQQPQPHPSENSRCHPPPGEHIHSDSEALSLYMTIQPQEAAFCSSEPAVQIHSDLGTSFLSSSCTLISSLDQLGTLWRKTHWSCPSIFVMSYMLSSSSEFKPYNNVFPGKGYLCRCQRAICRIRVFSGGSPEKQNSRMSCTRSNMWEWARASLEGECQLYPSATMCDVYGITSL